MHNWYFIEINNGKEWQRLDWYDNYFDFDDAVNSAKSLSSKYNGIRVVDECYRRIWWESKV